MQANRAQIKKPGMNLTDVVRSQLHFAFSIPLLNRDLGFQAKACGIEWSKIEDKSQWEQMANVSLI